MSLVEVLIASAILGVIALAFSTLFAQVAQQQQKSYSIFNLDQVRRNLTSLLSNNDHWQATLAANSATANPAAPDSHLSCLSTTLGSSKPNCAHQGDMTFKIFTSGGAEFFDPATQGFASDGTVCMQSENRCVLKLNLVVKTKCAPIGTPAVAPANCGSPSEVVISGLFQLLKPNEIQSSNLGIFNPANYAILIRKDSAFAAGLGAGGLIKMTCASATSVSVPSVIPANPCPTAPFSDSYTNSPSCVPKACPTGSTDIGVVSSLSGIAYAGSMYYACNVERLCSPTL